MSLRPKRLVKSAKPYMARLSYQHHYYWGMFVTIIPLRRKLGSSSKHLGDIADFVVLKFPALEREGSECG
jgi:hypothetical protein